MERVAAVRHLIDIARDASRFEDLSYVDWPLREMWIGGEILDGPETLHRVTVILMLDLPAGTLPWLAIPSEEQGVVQLLRLPKLPVRHFSRPITGPPWNPRCRRVLRFWTLESGIDGEIVAALVVGSRLDAVQPSDDEFAAQMRVELDRSRAHLDDVLSRYGEHVWRMKHRGDGIHPEDHLWRAARAVRDIETALAGNRLPESGR
jgi:hypothetical protein